jgi:diacylglycerol O-acyltransferase
MAKLERLSLADVTNLALEASDTPMHQAAFAVMDTVPLDHLRRHIAARLNRVPEMRRVLRPTRPPEGRPLWIDDPDFRIEDHVKSVTLPPPGGAAAALRFVEARMAELMDRSRPLWEMWLLEGYGPGRAGLLIKLHHALADGPAMVNLVGQVFDLGPEATEASSSPWRPDPPPGWKALIIDNLGSRPASWARAGRQLRHPVRLLRATATNARGALEAMRRGWDAPRTSLNRPVSAGRRIAVVRLPLGDVKALGHSAGVKLNDVFLCIVAGALSRVMRSRGEDLGGAPLRASMAVSLHPAHDGATAGNLVGTVVVPLPLDDLEPRERLRRIAAASAMAKARQRAVVTSGLMAVLAKTGFTRWYIRRQHLINVLTTSLFGPPVPLYLAGARVEEAFAIPPIAGNVTVTFGALSYAGTLGLSVVADATRWPDLDVLGEGLRASWLELRDDVPNVPAAEGRMALPA